MIRFPLLPWLHRPVPGIPARNIFHLICSSESLLDASSGRVMAVRFLRSRLCASARYSLHFTNLEDNCIFLSREVKRMGKESIAPLDVLTQLLVFEEVVYPHFNVKLASRCIVIVKE